MTKIFIFILLSIISVNSHADSSCNAGTGFEIAALQRNNQTEKANALFAKCKVVKPVSIKEIAKSNPECDSCWEKYGRNPIGRGVCGNTKKCPSPSLFGSVQFATVVAPCEGQMFCSEDTQMCQYICDNGYDYNFASGQCEMGCGENQIVENNQCVSCQGDKIPNAAQTACECPEGKVPQGNVCVEPNNPCEHLGSEYRYYKNQTPSCKIPTPKASYMSPCMGNNCFRTEMSVGNFNPQTSFNVSSQYVGCQKNGTQDNSVFRINYLRSEVRSYKHRTYSMPIYAVCTDANATGTNNPFLLGSFPTYMSDSDNYVKIASINNCYKYRLFIQDAYTFYDIGDYDIPYETCQECPAGMMKINGQCSCPSGMKVENNACVDQSNCGTASNFNAGKCQCSTPYSYHSINGMKYSCSNPPTYSRFGNPITKQSKTSLSASVTSCSGRNATVSWTASNDSDYPVSVAAVCMDPTYLELYPDPGPGEFSFYGFGGGDYVSGKGSSSGTIGLSVDGSCYNYKLVAIDTWTWMGETDFSLTYNCGQ